MAGAALSLAEVEARARARALDGLLDELRGRPDRMSFWLARALRVDLATITERPELALPCVWRHGHAVREPADLGILRPLLDAWRTQHGRRPWARALRPPKHPLWGALREEYRGAFAQAERVALRHSVIVVDAAAQQTSIDRRTGARTREPIELNGPRWEIDRQGNDDWGRCRVLDRTSGSTVVDVRINDDDSYTTPVATDQAQRILLVGGWCDDYLGVVTCIDVADGALRWRRELPRPVDGVGCSADGRTAFAFCRGQVFLLDGATGQPQQQGPVSGCLGALGPAGAELVTVDDHAVRVWDVAALRIDRPAVPRGCDQGFVDVMWSPDETRLLTGRALCDGVEGRPIRTIPLDSGFYLEGGPPVGGIALGEQLLVELSAFGGAALWDARTGARLATRRDGDRSRLGARYWFSPNAELYVEGFPRDDRPGVVRRTRDDALLGALDPRLSEVRWSADSRFFTTHGERARGHRLDGVALVESDPLPPAVTVAPYVPLHREGMLWLDARDRESPSYCLAEDDPLVPSSTGRRWAARSAHYALEP